MAVPLQSDKCLYKTNDISPLNPGITLKIHSLENILAFSIIKMERRTFVTHVTDSLVYKKTPNQQEANMK